jgi:hypothetical protein
VPAQDLLTARYTYASRGLAQFYGLPGADQLSVTGFQRVALSDDRRGGVLRQGSMLALTSRPDRGSPTRRGKWILERLLCDPPPPPPANVPALDPNVPFNGTLRQRLQMIHQKAGPACAGCHAAIDPMGFALEHYDAIGLWRDQDNGFPVDATGAMPTTGALFDGAAQLSQVIAADPRFASCVAKQLLTYALGRHVVPGDRPLIDDLGRKFAAASFQVPILLELVATSAPMTLRHAED